MAEKMDAALDYANQKVETAIDTNRKLRVGIIGCGWIAGAHIDSYKRMPDVEVVAGCDLIPGKAAKFFKDNGKYKDDICVSVNGRTCIRCYCCHEFCPVDAIELRKPWAERIFHLTAIAGFGTWLLGKISAFFKRSPHKDEK